MGAYSDRVIADGASYYWRLTDPSGTTAAALVGGAPGTISGGVTLGQAGPLADGSKAMLFDGATGKVQTALNLSLVLPLTIEAWVKGAWAADGGVVSNTAGGDGTGDFMMLAGKAAGQLRAYLEYSAGGGSRDVAGTLLLNNNQWHHLVIIFNPGVTPGTLLYVDAVADGSAGGAVATGSTNKPIAIGTSVKYVQAFAGAVAEVAIYPTALSAPTISAHYALRTATGGGTRSPIPWGAFAQQGSPT